MMMLPAITFSPPNFLTPRRRPAVSRPLRDDPPAFLCAIRLAPYSLSAFGAAFLAGAFLAAGLSPSVFFAAAFFAGAFLAGLAAASSAAGAAALGAATLAGAFFAGALRAGLGASATGSAITAVAVWCCAAARALIFSSAVSEVLAPPTRISPMRTVDRICRWPLRRSKCWRRCFFWMITVRDFLVVA